ncbi:MAG: sigma-70 family RNA polymerase sigma factor [Chloroflexales bacterium]|nr:sigma-70 family RNA polymerase sigma factor [Chloroflexales bacterium]
MKLPDPPPTADEQLVATVLDCQRQWHAWQAAVVGDERAAVMQRYQASVEELWGLIADDLRKVAHNWRRSNMASDIESLAMSHFAEVMVALPKMQLDPTRNVRHLLITIFRRGMISEYRRKYAERPPMQSREHGKAADEGAEKMWPSELRSANGLTPDATPGDLPDPHSLDAHEQLEQRLDGEKILAAVWSYWRATLSPDDQYIMEARWKAQPPRSFLDIATALGRGWEEATVRQRHRRVLQRTRRYLHDQHMLGDEVAF